MTDRTIATLIAVGFTAVWLVASAPFVAVLVEYRANPLLCDSRLGWFFARLYGSVFVYPPFFGSLALIALFVPATTAARYLKAHRSFALAVLGFVFLAPAAISVIAFAGEPTAPFEAKPVDLESLEGVAYLDGRGAALCPPVATELKPDAALAAKLKAQLATLTASGRSITGLLYYPGFVAGVVLHILIFVTLVVFVRIGRANIPRNAFLLKDANLVLLGSAMFLGAIWCLFRLTFRTEEIAIYGEVSNLVGDFAAIVLYFIFFGTFLIWFWVDIDKISDKAAVVVQVAGWIGSVLAVKFAVDPRSIFGSQVSLYNLFIIILMLVFISFFWFAVTGLGTGWARPRRKRRP